MTGKTVLILGAGINGAAIARELALNGISVCLVDRADIAGGATAYSSRLVHGGLRYLEHGEFRLVRESLVERRHLLRLAPQFVQPLELVVPVSDRTSGLAGAALRFLGIGGKLAAASSRGLWLIRMGLTLYDFLARGDGLPRHSVHAVGAAGLPAIGLPAVDPRVFRWLCAYHDAQVHFPERLVVAMLEDARRLAAESGSEFNVFPYHTASLQAKRVEIRSARATDGSHADPVAVCEPGAIINATGAWVDQTLRQLEIPSRRLIGGTKGSHFLTHHAGLRAALSGQGVYTPAADGRPVFLLPLGDATLVGTTDLPFDDSPESAVATEAELDYLVAAVDRVFPDLRFDRAGVAWHYSGVRPLPFVNAAAPASITRRHFIERQKDAAIPLFSIIGGKLTTARSLAEETAACVLKELGGVVRCNSRERWLPGGEDYPSSPDELARRQAEVAQQTGWHLEQVRAVWRLRGVPAAASLDPRSTEGLVHPAASRPLGEAMPATEPWPIAVPPAFVRAVLRDEWVTRLADLVERRLMLLYDEHLTRNTLVRLARLMAEEGKLGIAEIDSEVSACCERLHRHFGKKVE